MIDPEKLRAATKVADDYLARLTDPDFVRRRKRLFASVDRPRIDGRDGEKPGYQELIGMKLEAKRLSRKPAAIADTHPKDGDVKQAPLVSGGGSEGNRP